MLINKTLSIKAFNYKLRASYLTLAITLSVGPLAFISGLLELSHWYKETQKITKIKSQAKVEPAALNSTSDDFPNYTKVTLSGHYDSKHNIKIKPGVQKFKTGMEILTPFIITANGEKVYVNRGWVPYTNLSSENKPTETNMNITGFTLKRFGNIENIILLSPIQSNGYYRNWLDHLPDPNVYYGNAIKYLSFSLALIVMFIYLNVKKLNKNET